MGFYTSFDLWMLQKKQQRIILKYVFKLCSYKSNGSNFVNLLKEEPRYLSGIAAGLKTETNKIGFVELSHPEVIRAIDAFTLGFNQ